MNRFLLLVLCCCFFELLIKSNYIALINSLIEVSKKAIYIILNTNISDHCKENVLRAYALKMMQYSFQILLIFLSIIFIFFIADKFLTGLFEYIFSINGIIETILVTSIYAYFRKIIIK